MRGVVSAHILITDRNIKITVRCNFKPINLRTNELSVPDHQPDLLWKTAGIPFESYVKGSDFDYCVVPNSDWPNRLWFNGEIMKYLLNLAIETGKDYATLQASDMGKGLYVKLGFEEQFSLKHYSLE